MMIDRFMRLTILSGAPSEKQSVAASLDRIVLATCIKKYRFPLLVKEITQLRVFCNVLKKFEVSQHHDKCHILLSVFWFRNWRDSRRKKETIAIFFSVYKIYNSLLLLFCPPSDHNLEGKDTVKFYFTVTQIFWRIAISSENKG